MFEKQKMQPIYTLCGKLNYGESPTYKLSKLFLLHITLPFHPYIQKLLLKFSNVTKDNEIQFSFCLSLIFIYSLNEKMPLGPISYTCLDNKMNIAVVKTFLRT